MPANSPNQSESAKVQGSHKHCVAVVAPGADEPAGLFKALNQRQVHVRRTTSAPEAMALLAAQWVADSQHHAEIDAGERGIQIDSPFEACRQVVLLVEPALLQSADSLTNAIGAYFPDVVVWTYVFDREPQLVRIPSVPTQVHQKKDQIPQIERETPGEDAPQVNTNAAEGGTAGGESTSGAIDWSSPLRIEDYRHEDAGSSESDAMPFNVRSDSEAPSRDKRLTSDNAFDGEVHDAIHADTGGEMEGDDDADLLTADELDMLFGSDSDFTPGCDAPTMKDHGVEEEK